jgi:hypothetical protein
MVCIVYTLVWLTVLLLCFAPLHLFIPLSCLDFGIGPSCFWRWWHVAVYTLVLLQNGRAERSTSFWQIVSPEAIIVMLHVLTFPIIVVEHFMVCHIWYSAFFLCSFVRREVSFIANWWWKTFQASQSAYNTLLTWDSMLYGFHRLWKTLLAVTTVIGWKVCGKRERESHFTSTNEPLRKAKDE